MRNIVFRFVYVLVTFLMLSGCKVFKNNTSAPFILTDASYFSWVVDENENGTNIKLKLSGVDQGINLDSIIFRGVRLPITITKIDDETVVESILPNGFSRFPVDFVRVDKSDQLMYRNKGEKCVFLLNEIRREKMVYY